MKKFAALHKPVKENLEEELEDGYHDLLPVDLPDHIDKDARLPEYQVVDGVNYCNQVATMALLYLHVTTGAKIPNIFFSETQQFQEEKIIFQAGDAVKKK